MGHPIEGLMSSVLESIRDMIDVNTIVGEPIETGDGTVIIPISKVAFGFAAGGSDFNVKGKKSEKSDKSDKSDAGKDDDKSLLFGGGSGAGVTINPVAFLVVANGKVRLLPMNSNTIVDRILDFVPGILEKFWGEETIIFSKTDEAEEDLED